MTEQRATRQGLPMKLSELTPCIHCGGPVAPLFYRVSIEQCLIDATAANQVLGLVTMFGGHLAAAEAMAPNDNVTMTLQSNSGLVCQDCLLKSEAMVQIMFPGDEEE